MTIEMLRQALESIQGNSPIAVARRRVILAQIYALMEREDASE